VCSSDVYTPRSPLTHHPRSHITHIPHSHITHIPHSHITHICSAIFKRQSSNGVRISERARAKIFPHVRRLVELDKKRILVSQSLQVQGGGACVCVCVCVWVGEREREREREHSM